MEKKVFPAIVILAFIAIIVFAVLFVDGK